MALILIIGRSRRRMGAIYCLHAAGVLHGQLRDAGHFLYSEDGRVRIVGFSLAQLHHCPSQAGVPVYGRRPPPDVCGELSTMEVCLGICSAGWAVQSY